MVRRVMVVMALVAAALVSSAGIGATASSSVDCGDTLGPGGRYVLTEDLVCSGLAEPAITVVGPAELDLNGHTVAANPANAPEFGIRLEGTFARLLNGTVTGFARQDVLPDSGNVIVGGNGRHTITGITTIGLRGVVNTDEAGIQVLVGSDGNRIVDNIAQDADDQGIWVQSDDNFLANNTARNNGQEGFEDDGARNTWMFNTAAYQGEEGFGGSRATDSRFLFNESFRNDNEGMEFLDGSSGNLIALNSITLNDQDVTREAGNAGIDVRGTDNSIVGNRVTGNAGDGILLSETASGNTVSANLARDNGDGSTYFDYNDLSSGGPCGDDTFAGNLFVFFSTTSDPCIG